MSQPGAAPDYPALLRLDGQAHVVLGAGQGIGRAAAHALAAAGARVLCADRDPALAAVVAGEVGGSAATVDATDGAAVRNLFDGLGRLDGVTDVIGAARSRPLVDTTDDDWAWHHGVVLGHAVLALRHAAPRMASGGSVAFVASVAGHVAPAGQGAYGAYKAALMSLVRTAAVELGPVGIRVNAVAPGVVRTPRLIAYPGFPFDRNAAATPLRRVAEPADVAGVLLFLASGLARHVTGQTVVVDGGAGAVSPVINP